MARHRNVRSMNYSDEYDGYDDVYGHSVEDEYCISPSDEAQFMYDRTRQPQISAFFSEQDNITEEDESLDQTNDRKNSDCFIRPTLSDLEEAKLLSCLEEIRNVIGDSISERILVETVLKCNFNVNKSLDTILSNATSSNEIISEDPKPQRVRRERDRDFINFQNDLQCLVNPSVLKKLSENINAIDLQDLEQDPCHGVSLNKKSEEDINNKLTVEHNQAASCSFIPELCEQRSLSPKIMNRNLSLDCNHSLTICNIPSLIPRHSVVNDSNRTKKKKFEVQIDDSVQIGDVSSSTRVDSCSSTILKNKGILGGKIEEQSHLSLSIDSKLHESPSFKMDVDLSNSSDEEGESSPLVLLSKRLSYAGKKDQELMQSNLLLRGRTEGEKEIKDQCQAFRNLTIQESGLPYTDILQRSKGVSGILGSVEKGKGRADAGGSSHETDNSDDENSPFSPLAALANRHRKHKSTENCLSEENKIQPISRGEHEGSGADKDLNKILRSNISEAESSCGSKEKSLSVCTSQRDCLVIDKSSDDEENTFSPLAALAGKINRCKGDSESRSDLSSSSSVASGLEQRCSHLPIRFPAVNLMSGSEDGKVTKILCRCKSESDGYSSSSPSLGSMCMNMDNGTSCQDQGGLQSVIRHCDTEPVCNVPLFSHASSEDRESGTQKKSASSLSDLAFFHLTRSASCGTKSDHELANKRVQSDTGISKSVPGGFVIPFLKQEGCDHGIWKNGSREQREENKIEMNAESSDDDWVIDLSNAIRDPGLRLSDNVAVLDDDLPAQVIDVSSIEELPQISYVAPCVLDASELLKMKFPRTKRRCSSFGKVLCRQWRELARPYVPLRKQYTGSIVHYTFNEDSPDDIVFKCQKGRNGP